MVRRRSRVRNCPLPMGKVPLARDRKATGPGTEWLLTWLFPRVSGWGHRSLESSWPQIALLIKKQRIQKFYKGLILSLTALLDFEHEYVHAHKHIYPGLYNLKVYYSYEAICSILNPCFSSNQLKPLPPSCPTLCNPMDCSLPGTSVHGISQARTRILEWVAISFSRGCSHPRDQTCASHISRWILYCWTTMWFIYINIP